MKPSVRAINLNACAQRVQVDNRISLHYYYRIADNLLKQLGLRCGNGSFSQFGPVVARETGAGMVYDGSRSVFPFSLAKPVQVDLGLVPLLPPPLYPIPLFP